MLCVENSKLNYTYTSQFEYPYTYVTLCHTHKITILQASFWKYEELKTLNLYASM